MSAALLLLVCAWAGSASAESDFGVLQRAREIPVSAELQKLTESPIQRAESVDLTGDGVPDFILGVGPAKELWVASDGTLLRSTLLYRTPIWERWFVNLDADPEPELLTAYGYEDGVDFQLTDQTQRLGAQQDLFRLLPVFRAKGDSHALGLPGNLDGARVVASASGSKLACSFDYPEEFLFDAGVTGPPEYPQRLLPVVFFESPAVPGEARFPIQSGTALSLQEIVQRSRAHVPDLVVRQQTLVAFHPQSGSEGITQDDVDADSDFRWHLAGVHEPLTAAGIAVSEHRGAELIVKNDGQVEIFVPGPSHGGVGYYLASPGKPARVLRGVHTDMDLLFAAADYFCLPEWLPEDEAVRRGCPERERSPSPPPFQCGREELRELRGVLVDDLPEEWGPPYGGVVGDAHHFLTLDVCGESAIVFGRSGDTPRVLDAMSWPELEGEQSVVITLCRVEGEPDPEILAVVDYDPDRRGFAALRAWRMNRRTERIEPIPSLGVVCTNESYGL